MNGKVDYLKVEIAGDGRTVVNDLHLLNNYYELYAIEGEGGKRSGKREYHRANTGENTLRLWWECWGPVSDFILSKLPVDWYPKLKRLDWREEMTSPTAFDRDELHKYALAHIHPRTRCTAIDAPPSGRRHGGRDSGGRFLGIGSHSGKRVIHNQRVGEVPYTEAQIAAKMLPGVLARANQLYSAEPFRDMAACVREALREEHDGLCMKYFGRGLLTITGEVPRVDTMPLPEPSHYDQAIALFRRLDWVERQDLLGVLLAETVHLEALDHNQEPEDDDGEGGVAEPQYRFYAVSKPGVTPYQINVATQEEAEALIAWVKEWEGYYHSGAISFDEYACSLQEFLETFASLPIPRVTPIGLGAPDGPWINPSDLITPSA